MTAGYPEVLFFSIFLCVLLQRDDLIPIMRPDFIRDVVPAFSKYERGTGIHTDGAIFLNPTIRLSDVHSVLDLNLNEPCAASKSRNSHKHTYDW